jgi:hypothetical protein
MNIQDRYTTDDAIEDGIVIPLTDEGEEEIDIGVCRPIHEIKSIDGYLLSYGNLLGKKAVAALRPLHLPGVDPLPDFDYDRDLFPAQQHVVAAAVKMFDARGSGFICGEMGTGKTIIGMAAVHEHASRSRKKGGCNGKYRAIVLCPDHLVGKWCREIRETIPEAVIVRFGPQGDEKVSGPKKRKGKGEKVIVEEANTRKTMRDTLALLSKSRPAYKGRSRWEKPEGPEFYILGRNQAKWLSLWAGIADEQKSFANASAILLGGPPALTPRKNAISSKNAIIDKVQVKDEHGYPKYDSHYKPVTKAVLGRVHTCPKCGSVVKDKKGTPVGAKDLTSNKGAKRKCCEATLLKSIYSVERPNDPGGQTISPIPEEFSQRKPGSKVKYLDREWLVQTCGEPLYNFTSKPYRWAPSAIIQRKLKRMFKYLIIDEVHEHKSDSAAQSMAASKLIGAVDHVLALTGTIIGGYADHLYPLMMRITPTTLREEGFEWGHSQPFSETYGRVRTVVTTTEAGDGPTAYGRSASMRKSRGKSEGRKYIDPGVMPTMFARHMMGTSIFITLEELAENLPDLFEYVGGHIVPEPDRRPGESQEDYDYRLDLHKRNEDGWFETAVDMAEDQKAEYDRIMEIITETNKELLMHGSMRFLAAMLWTGLDFPDRPFGWGHDIEVQKAITEAEGDIPALLGQSFLKHFSYAFDPKTETLSLTPKSGGETDRIPLAKDNGVYKIDVVFNGRFTKSLYYDTGASTVSMSEVMAAEIGVTQKSGDRDGLAQIADGSVMAVKQATINSVRVGKFTVENVECSIKPLKLPHTIGYWQKPGSKHLDNWVGVVTPRDLPEDVVYPKEQRLIDICKKQHADGRQTWVYVNMTNKRNIQPRLKKLLEAEGLRVGVLRADTCQPIEREAWIEQNGRDYDVMLSHPELVKTGLDLFSKNQGGHNYPTIVFYETGYNIFTMRQAARRSWRIGQPCDCRVYYLYYRGRGSMQQKAMHIVSRKTAAAMAVEGEFSEDGLAAMAGEDNMQMALAKKLSERISEADTQRNWGKVKSSPKKKKVGSALDKMSPEDQEKVTATVAAEMIAETIEDHIKKKLAQVDDAFLAATRDTADEWEEVADEKDLDEETGDEFYPEPKEEEVPMPKYEGAPVILQMPAAKLAADDEDEDDDYDEDEEDDDEFVMPELTPEILAKMFANMREHGLM